VCRVRDCAIFADKGFIGEAWQTEVRHAWGNCLWTTNRANQRTQNTPAVDALFALLLNSAALRRWRLIGLARSRILIPWVTLPVVAVAVWQWLAHPRYGAINQIMMDSRLIESGANFSLSTLLPKVAS